MPRSRERKFNVRFFDQTKETISKQNGHTSKIKPKFPGLHVSSFVRDEWIKKGKVSVKTKSNNTLAHSQDSSTEKLKSYKESSFKLESKEASGDQSKETSDLETQNQEQIQNKEPTSQSSGNNRYRLDINSLVIDAHNPKSKNNVKEAVDVDGKDDDNDGGGNDDYDEKHPSMDQFLDYPFSVEDTKLLEKELSGLIQPAESYGFYGLEENKGIWNPSDDKYTFNFELSNHSADEDSSSHSSDKDAKNSGLNILTKPTVQYPQPLSDAQIFSLNPVNPYNEFRLINHYCRTMCSFYSVKDPAWNFYTYVSDRLTCRYDPLKYALLAWSALHISIVEELSFSAAKKYYTLSLRAVMGNNTLFQGGVPMELFLATAYFLVHFDIMDGTKHAYKILRYVWSTLRIGRFFQSGPGPTLSPFGYQIVVWLLYLDIRSSLFVGNISFPDYILKQDRNPNIEYLSTSNVYEKRAILNIFSRSRKLLSHAYGAKYPKEYSKDDEIQEKILILMVRNMMMFGRLIRLRNWLNQCGNSTEFDANSLKNEISKLYDDNQNLLKYSGKSRMSSFHVLIENALIYSIIIYFDRICYPDIRTNSKCQKAASEILKIAVQLKKLRSHGTPGSTQWPFPLFIAGVETTDVIYQKWITEELKECDEEGWGLHLGKMRQLFKACIERQEETRRRVDIGDIMQRVVGVFVL